MERSDENQGNQVMSPVSATDAPLTERITALLGRSVRQMAPLAGGDLSSAFAILLDDGRRLVAKPTPQAWAEAAMLGAIGMTGAPAPAIVAIQSDLIVMDRLENDGRLAGPAWADLATVLQRLHVATDQAYGWREDHAFGPLAIANDARSDWPAFWADNRIRCHIPYIAADLSHRLDTLADRLGEYLPHDPPPALLHGDLWGGNILVSAGRITGLIDPACYHGDREVDVAMLTLFDHPPPAFFDALDLAPGWQERQPVYRLWPLLVHLRLFGEGYAPAVAHALDLLGC